MPDEPIVAATTSIISRRHFIVGGGLAAMAAGSQAALPKATHPRISNSAFEKWVPKDFGSWKFVSASGVVLPPSDATSDRLYDNLITRVYEGTSGAPVMLLIAYNNIQNGVLQVHRPEVCYPAGGYTLTESEPMTLSVPSQPVLPSKFFTAKGPDRIEQVLYFTRLGDSFPRSWLEQRIAVAKANLAGIIPDGVLMRVSSVDNDKATALNQLNLFLREFFSIAPPELKRMLLGAPGKQGA